MNLNPKKVFYCFLGIILGITTISQAIEKNYLALFTFVGSVGFFIRAWRTKNN